MDLVQPRSFLKKNHRAIFYLSWLILGLIQAGLTELQDDEAYYWVYSKYLDWGYFDHPPMTGLLVKMGYAIFPNELGVRLFPLLLNVFSLVIIEKLIINKNHFLFYTIALSVAVLQLTGFVAVPDIPLIFFTALFFYCYKNFTRRFTLLNTFLLGVAIALLFYSKYHALLIVIFTLLSNIKLFTKYQTYLAGIIALLIFLPHLWWQYQHDWVSLRYHLLESNVNPYKPSFTSDYILGQLLIPGPLAGIILLPAAFLYKPINATEKALRYTMIGIYAFFLLSSFRGRVEANWTSPVLVSLFILSHQYLNQKLSWQKFLFRLLPFTLLLVLFARIAIIVDILPVKEIKSRYHSWEKWPQELKQRTGGLPVVFINSYQRASKYWFYSGQTTYSQNWYRERRNNYNFWPIEDSMLARPAWVFNTYGLSRYPDSLQTPIGWIGYRYEPVMLSFAKVQIACTPGKIRLKAGEDLILHCRFEIPEHYSYVIRSQPELNDSTRVGVFKKGGWVADLSTPFTLKQMSEEKQASLNLPMSLPKGKYYLRFTIQSGDGIPTHNSDKIEMLIE
ncbi:MAG: glycosyltransferase family 39 protein [Ferruginibacter sp.]|nr:glycosyltransferase family 39 protein [Chitinophagaceae bacterium]